VTVVGIAAGAGASLGLGRVARNLLYQISPNDALSLAAAAALMIAVAALAALVPSLRAARVDPAQALKAE
jgi:putative ABC transport system permease protein